MCRRFAGGLPEGLPEGLVETESLSPTLQSLLTPHSWREHRRWASFRRSPASKPGLLSAAVCAFSQRSERQSAADCAHFPQLDGSKSDPSSWNSRLQAICDVHQFHQFSGERRDMCQSDTHQKLTRVANGLRTNLPERLLRANAARSASLSYGPTKSFALLSGEKPSGESVRPEGCFGSP